MQSMTRTRSWIAREGSGLSFEVCMHVCVTVCFLNPIYILCVRVEFEFGVGPTTIPGHFEASWR